MSLTARIDLDAIAHNTRLLKRQAGDANLVCIVKADAYNHGVARCVPVMEANGADAFGVATLAEAREARSLTSLPVMCWLWDLRDDIPEDIELAAPTMEHLHRLIDAPFTPTTYLKVETGMHRSGFDENAWEEVFALAAEAQRAGSIRVKGLMSHLAYADNPQDPYTDTQAERFRAAISRGRAAGLELSCNHLANTAATWSRPDLHFDQVRPGLSLYGMDPIVGQGTGTDKGLHPAMSWVADILAVKHIGKGEPVSYGLTWHAPRDGFTAVVPAGYADGVSRAWQPHLQITVRGKRYPVVGRVCMDQMVIWLDANEDEVTAGDEAVIFGPGGMSATELAGRIGTIDYEVLCSPKGRTRREYR
ncbi:alanine racemase [Corynebacterium sp. HMSC29G08]|uniref:alanine racemase n=1 Tax=Corynebacterium sp. HMSC29G08 TaxID=1581069 RepID=UPI0008A5FADB|nr:alanine racemase [Corynebacterium sp. HMSC29G08]OFT82272.1 alanine racemase [Corynebacterium sp. HMSC29G08]